MGAVAPNSVGFPSEQKAELNVEQLQGDERLVAMAARGLARRLNSWGHGSLPGVPNGQRKFSTSMMSRG